MVDWVGDAQEDADETHEEPKLFQRFRVSDILPLADEPIKFIIRGFLIDGTHGMLAGEEKTLKSYIGTFIDLAILSGEPLFGRFAVERRGPVVVYVGEGGKRGYLRRVKRIGAAMGIDVAAVTEDYYILTETAPIGSDKFRLSYERDLQEIVPVLARMDPYYAYHGSDADPKNLHQEGANLNLVSEPAYKYGSNAFITNHFNQGGRGLHLKRITMAGGSEWVDSWILVEKHGGEEAQDVLNGDFVLRLKVGGREIGEQQWELRLSIGRFDMESNEHVGDVSWSIRPLLTSPDAAVPRKVSIRSEAIEILTQHPWELSKSELKKRISGNDLTINTQLTSELKKTGETELIMERKVPIEGEDGVTRRLPRLGLSRIHPDVPDNYPFAPEGSTRA